MRNSVQGVAIRRKQMNSPLTTQKAAWMFHRMAEHLGLSPEEAEEYWPGFYEMRLMGQLDYLTAVDVEEPHCLIGSVIHQKPEHDYRHPLPAGTVARLLAQMDHAHQAWKKSRYREAISTALQNKGEQKEEDEVSS